MRLYREPLDGTGKRTQLGGYDRTSMGTAIHFAGQAAHREAGSRHHEISRVQVRVRRRGTRRITDFVLIDNRDQPRVRFYAVP